MAEVFISLIYEEQRIAQAVQGYLKENLKDLGRPDVFLSADDWQVFGGEVWLDRIKQELREARVVILMLSSRSVQRPWINFEAGAAWLADKAVIPVCFGGLTKGNMPKPYSGIQGLDLPQATPITFSALCGTTSTRGAYRHRPLFWKISSCKTSKPHCMGVREYSGLYRRRPNHWREGRYWRTARCSRRAPAEVSACAGRTPPSGARC